METTEHYLADLRFRTLEQANIWQGVAQKFGAAYASEYERWTRLLNNIKAAIEEDRKRTEAMMGFALGLLTGGLIGPIADRVVGRAFKSEAVKSLTEATKLITADELLTEWTANSFKELVKLGDERVRGLVLGQIAPGGLESPTGGIMSPAEYGDRLKLGMSQRSIAMSSIAKIFYDTLTWLPPERALALNKTFTSNAFFDAFGDELLAVDDKDLKRSAAVMLWIAWGKVRDVEFWTIDSALLRSPMDAQGWLWAPLLKELESLRVPVQSFTFEGLRSNFWGVERAKTIDMLKFIAWAKGSTAASVAFAGLPLNEAGRKIAEQRLTVLNSVPQGSWIDLMKRYNQPAAR